MPCRWQHLEKVYQGYLKSGGTSLIEHDGTQYVTFGAGDDIGMYILIPKIAKLFNISLQTTTYIFFGILFWVPAIISFIGFMYLYKNWSLRIFILINFAIFLLSIWQITDLYLMYSAVAFITVPWALVQNASNNPRGAILFYFLIGLLFGIAHFIRSYAWLPCAGFLLPFLIYKYTKQHSVQFFFALTLGFLLPCIYFNYQYKQYEKFAKTQFSDPELLTRKHPFWHTVFLGFGFLKQNNPENISYDDNWGFNHIIKKHPEIKPYTSAYENALKEETIQLCKKHPLFILHTFFAKLGILLLYLLIFANIGLLVTWFFPSHWLINVAFFCALAPASIFPLISLPTIRACSLSFIIFAWLFGLVSVNNGRYVMREKSKILLNRMKLILGYIEK